VGHSAASDELQDTVDYVALRSIVSQEMAVRAKLLENVCDRVALRALEEHPKIERVKLSIAKLNPPIDGDVNAVAVVWDVRR